MSEMENKTGPPKTEDSPISTIPSVRDHALAQGVVDVWSRPETEYGTNYFDPYTHSNEYSDFHEKYGYAPSNTSSENIITNGYAHH